MLVYLIYNILFYYDAKIKYYKYLSKYQGRTLIYFTYKNLKILYLEIVTKYLFLKIIPGAFLL